jgi:ABC-type dipeptide/oligopeptide/nickel transport system ATPase component
VIAMTDPASAALLEIRNLAVRFRTSCADVHAVAGVNLDVRAGECLGLVGESGSGKSQLVLAVLGLLAPNGYVTGSARFGDVQMLGAARATLDRIRGRDIGLVFQEPLASLTPHLRVGEQVAEVLRVHRAMSTGSARARAIELLERMRIADAGRRAGQYPHELSGGMRQRVALAIALAAEPRLLIADEPTSALDVTVQAEMLDLLHELRRERSLAIVLITHDFGVVADLADRIAVMQGGRIVEEEPASRLLRAPRHPYTAALLAAVPRLEDPLDRELASEVRP